VFAALAFVFMGYLLTSLGLIDEQVTLLNAVFGRLRGRHTSADFQAPVQITHGSGRSCPRMVRDHHVTGIS
jgi:TRAP-type C4-dicarboxylate transport system permease large subunit